MRNKNINKKNGDNTKKRYNKKIENRDTILSNVVTNQEENKNRRKINKARLIVTLSFLMAIVIYLCIGVYKLIKNPTLTVVVKEGRIAQEETINGYIIRDEVVIKGENYKNGMVKIKNESEKVANGDPIFRYYSSGEENLKKKISELDIKIQDAMAENNEDLFTTDTKLLDNQIESKLMQMDDINSVQRIMEYKKDIEESITKKAKIAGELSPSGSYLKKLINERSEYEKQLNSGAEYINASKSGIVSYKIDGLEETLNSNDFSKISKDFLNGLNLKAGQIISTSNEAGKIINNFICYIACTSKSDEANAAKIGDKVKIVLPSSKEVSAKIEYITKETDDESTIIFSITEGIDELSSYRKTAFDIIWWDESGYKVPNSSIITENNLNYVIRTKSGYQEKVLVKVKKKTDLYSIVSNYSTSEIKELNIDDDVLTSIILYDELLLNQT